MLYWSRLNKLIFIFALVLPVLLGAQGYQYSGTRFYFPDQMDLGLQRTDIAIVLNVYSEVDNCLVLSLPKSELRYEVNISAANSVAIGLDTCFGAYRDNSGTLADSLADGYLVTSAYPILLEFHNFLGGTSLTYKENWSYNIPPVEQLGNEYIFFEQSTEYIRDRFNSSGNDCYFSLFAVDSVVYNIKTVLDTDSFFKANIWNTLYRAPYEVLYDYSKVNSGMPGRMDNSRMHSLNGTHFGVYYRGISVDVHNCFWDYPIPMQWRFGDWPAVGFMPDVEKAGTRYAVTSIQYGNGPRMRCMSVEDSNRVYVNGVQVAQLNQGEVWDTCGYDEAIVESDKPILLGYNTSNMYRVDSTYGHRPTGAMSYYVPHTGQMINYARFKAESFRYADSFFVNLQCRTADTALFVHNGAPWKNLGFKPFTHDPSYSYARVNIAAGEHSIKNPNGFIGVHYSMTLNLPFKPGFQDPETRFEDYIYPLGGIAPEDTVIRPYTYSTDGVNFRAFTKDSPVKLCEGKPLYLLASNVSNTEIKWDFDNGDTLLQQVEDEEIDMIVVSFANAGNYSITTSVLNWPCVKGDTLFVQVQDPGILDFEYQVHQGCDGNILTAWATSSSYTDYRWLLEGKQVGDGGQLEYALKASDSELELVLIAASEFCNDTVLQEILLSDPQQGLVVPNVFTPNGDGVNECFLIEGVAGYESCYELSIFNRWGKKVFTSSDPKQCWDGGTVNSGVYYYVLDIGKEEYKGNLFLNR